MKKGKGENRRGNVPPPKKKNIYHERRNKTIVGNNEKAREMKHRGLGKKR